MIRKWYIALLILGVVLGVLMFFDGSYRSMRYFYPVTVDVPNGLIVRAVSYECVFKPEHAQLILDDIDDYKSSFETVKGLNFDAEVRGHHNTRWFGLIENKGRETVVIVRVESDTGEHYVGVTELPPNEGQVTVKVQKAN